MSFIKSLTIISENDFTKETPKHQQFEQRLILKITWVQHSVQLHYFCIMQGSLFQNIYISLVYSQFPVYASNHTLLLMKSAKRDSQTIIYKLKLLILYNSFAQMFFIFSFNLNLLLNLWIRRNYALLNLIGKYLF